MRRLIQFRWLAVVGEFVNLLIVTMDLQLRLPVTPLRHRRSVTNTGIPLASLFAVQHTHRPQPVCAAPR
jgi:hypothetical protein